ncbi:MAG: sigma-70 family RNA polymerase sigma factor, partial [Phycisphaerales bacterium]
MDPSTRRALADWRRAQPAVSAFVHALVHDRAERDDVLQDVAVAVLESHHRYDPSRPFLAWALTIARNEVVDSLRRRRRRPALLGTDAADALAEAIALGHAVGQVGKASPLAVGDVRDRTGQRIRRIGAEERRPPAPAAQRIDP